MNGEDSHLRRNSYQQEQYQQQHHINSTNDEIDADDTSSSPPVIISDVWADNLEDVMEYIMQLVEDYPIIAMVQRNYFKNFFFNFFRSCSFVRPLRIIIFCVLTRALTLTVHLP